MNTTREIGEFVLDFANAFYSIDYASFKVNNPYQYGFNGQEKDNEVGEGITTALYWEYDSRIGRRWNLDPDGFIEESPYSCFGDNPIRNSDIFGNKWDPTMWDERSYFNPNRYCASQYVHFLIPNSKDIAQKSINTMVVVNPLFKRAWNDVKKSSNTYSIDEINGFVNGNEKGNLTGEKISLIKGKFDKGTIFEEVYHAGQKEFYKGKQSGLATEVEAKVAKAVTGVKDDFKMSDDEKSIMSQYYTTLTSGGEVDKDLRGKVNSTLTRLANYLVTDGGYEKYKNELKDFKPEDSMKYFEKGVKESSNKTK